MNAGPTMAEKAAAAFDGAAPDWIAALAELVDREGLRGAGKRIGYSPAALSNVLRARYTGDVARVEEKVRGALLGVTVECPVLGTIGRNECLDWQKKPFAATSSVRVAVYRACRGGCPHSALSKGSPS
jgi:hypothetical protein